MNVDLQNCFVDGPLAPADGLAVLDRVNRLAEVCRSAGILVVHTSHVFRPDGSNAGVLRETAPDVINGAILNKGAPSAALHPGLRVDPRDILVEKPRFGAFHSTDLELILRDHGIDTIIIAGIATNVCCDTTAYVPRDASVSVSFFATWRLCVSHSSSCRRPADARRRRLRSARRLRRTRSRRTGC